jgi:hypothetical protein
LYKDGILPVETYSNKRPSIKVNINKEQLINQFDEQSLAAQATPITYIVDYSYVNDIVQNYDVFSPHYSLIDVRSYAQHIRGRIPTSLWARSINDYLNPDGTMRAGVDILAMWDELGIDYKRKHLIFYSNDDENNDDEEEEGTTTTTKASAAAEIMFYAELMGLYKISVYEGGWREWSRMANNTFQMGPSTDSESISFETPEHNENLFKTTITTKFKTTTSTSTSHSTTTTATMTSTKRSTTTTTGSNTNMRRNITTANSFFKEQFDRATAPTPPLLNNKAARLPSFVFDLIVILVIVFFF